MVALRVITVMLRLLITMFLMRVIMVDDKVCDHGGDGDEEADNGDDYPGKIHFWKWSWWSLKLIAMGRK